MIYDNLQDFIVHLALLSNRSQLFVLIDGNENELKTRFFVPIMKKKPGKKKILLKCSLGIT